MDIRSCFFAAVIASLSTAPAAADIRLQADGGVRRLSITTETGTHTYAVSDRVVAVATIEPPLDTPGFLVATFTAESVCTGSPGGYCNIIIYCGEVELHPQSGTNFAFDSVGPTSYSSNWHSLSVTRRSDVDINLGGLCTVVENLVGGATAFRLDDWTFKVEWWRR